MLETCRFHDRSLVMVTPKYLTESAKISGASSPALRVAVLICDVEQRSDFDDFNGLLGSACAQENSWDS